MYVCMYVCMYECIHIRTAVRPMIQSFSPCMTYRVCHKDGVVINDIDCSSHGRSGQHSQPLCAMHRKD